MISVASYMRQLILTSYFHNDYKQMECGCEWGCYVKFGSIDRRISGSFILAGESWTNAYINKKPKFMYLYKHLSSSALDKMAAISQTILSDTFFEWNVCS